MSTKMRVRELSAELGTSNKELLQLLRELGIQVKSHMSGLTQEEVESVRNRFQENTAQAQVEDKRTHSGVIVRRRRKTAPERTAPKGSETSQPTSEAAEVGDRIKEKTESVEEGTKAGKAPQEPGLPLETEIEQPVPESTFYPEREGELQKEPSEQDQAEPQAAKTESSPQAESEESKKQKSKKRKKSKKKVISEAPSVTVISRPEHEVEQQVEQPEPSEPVAAEPEKQATETTEDKKKAKKKKKDKRFVDVSALYQEEEQPKTPSKTKKKSTAEAKEKPAFKTKGKKKVPEKTAESKTLTQPTKAAKRKVKVDEAIRLSDLAKQMGVKAQDLIKKLLSLGVMATINQSLDIDTATLVASEYGYEVDKVGFSEENFILPKEEDKPEELMPRPPVVTIMGHVDHGKTSLLDAIRESNIISGEAGGITQHIGAYYVQTPRGSVVFLDTPGHEAFTAMRARGAQVTDIVILVVAADDGVMDQTREAINHSKAAGVPIIVAVNKIDKENADLERVKRELAENGLVSEEWGGDTIYVNVSAKQLQGIDPLLEMVLLQSEILELTSNPNKRARGHIVEAKLDKGRGPVGTVLVQEGTLRLGDPFVCGLYHGKVRAMFNDKGQNVESAGPAIPVEVQGFEGVPDAGDEYVVVADDKVARRIAESRKTKQRERELAKESKVTLESFLAERAHDEVKSLNLILKADVQGSLEAVSESLQKISTDAVKVNIIHGGAGAITESDIMLASASSAIIIGFNVRPTAKIRDIAEKEGVEIRFYNVIYHLVNEVKEAMAGMLAPITREVYLGQAEVRDTFNIPKVGTIAGCYVVDGKLMRNAGIRLLRDGVVIYSGKLNSLKRFKDDAKEVSKGYECGAGLANFNDIRPGDIIEAFEEVQEKATL
jgi:translation initiation factor IF-2